MRRPWVLRHKVTTATVAMALLIVVGSAAAGAWSDVSSQRQVQTTPPVGPPSGPRSGTPSPAPASMTPAGQSTAPTRPTAAPTRPTAGTALAALALLPVKGRAPMTGYSREQFGQAWYDQDRNGCDTRNDMLRRDLSSVVVKAGTYGCLVLGGVLHDPYSGTTISFVRGVRTSVAVQIDHVVALADAWQKGAQALTFETRRALANDPLNLLAVQGRLNQQKGAGDAATWLPPSKATRPQYVARQIAVKLRYRLWVTAAEKAAMARVLAARPGTQLPTSGRPVASPTPAAPTRGAPTTRPSPRTDVWYANCTAVRAAGKAPLLRGQPGYGSHLDRDDDGIACE